METFQIRILEKFGVSSVVMPYFGYAHQSFLLLSRLSRGSRAMLDDFYREIINWLYEWNMVFSIEDLNIKMLYLPSDLFKYLINLEDKTILQQFIEFLTMIHQHKGYYFNSHYMHERLWILALYDKKKYWNKDYNPSYDFNFYPNTHYPLLSSFKVLSLYSIVSDYSSY